MKKLILGLVVAIVIIVALPMVFPLVVLPVVNKFIVSISGTRILLINDFLQPVTVRILRDDGDRASNKSWSQIITLQPNTRREYAEVGQVYCLLLIKQDRDGTSFALPIEKINDASKEQRTASEARPLPMVRLSELRQSCPFDATDPPRNE